MREPVKPGLVAERVYTAFTLNARSSGEAGMGSCAGDMTVGRAGALSSDFLRSPLARRIGAHVAAVVLLAGVLLEG